jgi:hypothetical protein
LKILLFKIHATLVFNLLLLLLCRRGRPRGYNHHFILWLRDKWQVTSANSEPANKTTHQTLESWVGLQLPLTALRVPLTHRVHPISIYPQINLRIILSYCALDILLLFPQIHDYIIYIISLYSEASFVLCSHRYWAFSYYFSRTARRKNVNL